MNHIIQNDINNLLFSISIKYKIDLDLLRDRYLPIIDIEKKKYKFKRKITPRSQTVTSHITQPHTQCCARVWNGGHASFDAETNQWIYGGQCTKIKYANKKYCSLHLKKLVHGDFFLPPPHPHFDKFKTKEDIVKAQHIARSKAEDIENRK